MLYQIKYITRHLAWSMYQREIMCKALSSHGPVEITAMSVASHDMQKDTEGKEKGPRVASCT
jgi:hypothetical protein